MRTLCMHVASVFSKPVDEMKCQIKKDQRFFKQKVSCERVPNLKNVCVRMHTDVANTAKLSDYFRCSDKSKIDQNVRDKHVHQHTWTNPNHYWSDFSNHYESDI